MRLIFTIALLLVGCSTAQPRAKVILDQDGFVSSAIDAIPQPVKKGDEREVEESAPFLFEAAGHLPLLVLPPVASADQVLLRLKPLGQDETRSQELDSLLGEVLRAQSLLRDSKAREALTLTEDLISRYPKVAQLKKLKAGCLVVLGQRKAAQVILQEGKSN